MLIRKTFIEDTNKILVIDSQAFMFSMVENILHSVYQNIKLYPVQTAKKATEIFGSAVIDLVIINISSVNGETEQLLKYIKESHSHVPVIAVFDTPDDQNMRIKYLKMGVTAFLGLPFVAEELLFMVTNLLTMKVNSSGLERIENLTIALVRAIEAKDPYTKGHAERTAYYSVRIFDELGLQGEQRNDLFTGCILHDIGKLAMPDSILNKKGKLTPEEFDVIKQHPIRGARICEGVHLLKDAAPVIVQHHERLDGSGYPHGLIESEINILAQIAGIADAFDALTTDRSYRKALSPSNALSMLEIEVDDGKLNSLFFSVLKKIIQESDEELPTINE